MAKVDLADYQWCKDEAERLYPNWTWKLSLWNFDDSVGLMGKSDDFRNGLHLKHESGPVDAEGNAIDYEKWWRFDINKETDNRAVLAKGLMACINTAKPRKRLRKG